MKLISGTLILITAFLSISHGWSGLSGNVKPEDARMLADIGFTKPLLSIIGVLSLAVGVMVLIPQTFFLGNLLNAFMILLIMAFSLRSGVIKTFLVEIPFLIMPLALIWLGHPFKR